MSPELWFIKKDQKGPVYGPISREQLQEYWQSRKISAKVLLSTDQQQWRTVEQVMAEPINMESNILAVHPHHEAGSLSHEPVTRVTHPELPPLPASLGRYEIMKELGHGGMGVVYQAMDTQLKRTVAIKMLLASNMKDIHIQRFAREAEITAKLSHPNIVQIHDFGIRPQCYIIMEFIAGRSFHDLLQDKHYTLRKKLEIFRQVCQAVDYGHQQNIIHRDLKPQNIMVTENNIAKVMDFGLAKSLTVREMRLSQTGQVIGTIQYMSPEQADGDKVDHRTDIYSLGVILYEILTGRTPYTSDNAVNMLSQLADEKPALPKALIRKIPKALQKICMKCLEKNPDDRYATAQLLGDDIQAYLENQPISISENKILRRTSQWIHHHKSLVALVVVLICSAVIFPILYRIKKIENPTYQLPVEVWNACRYEYQGEAILDMTSDYWCRLSPNQQSQYASQYQKGYAAAKGLTLEKTIPLVSLPSSAQHIVMRLIPPGRFWMGSPEDEPCHNIVWQYVPREKCIQYFESDLSEGPRHRVVISRAYYLSKYECTQAQWMAVMGNNPAEFKNAGQDSPVEKVTWDAIANGNASFCGKTNLILPSECQWEYATRAGTIRMSYLGNFEIKGAFNAPELSPIAWYGGNSGVTYAGGRDSRGWPQKEQNHTNAGTHPVGQKQPNGFGLYDTLGNVLEWCGDAPRNYNIHDEYDPFLAKNNAAAFAFRGGCWSYGVPNMRCAYRSSNKCGYAENHLGFRPASPVR